MILLLNHDHKVDKVKKIEHSCFESYKIQLFKNKNELNNLIITKCITIILYQKKLRPQR